MLNRDQFAGGEKNRERKPAACLAWAELLPDAAEGLLSEAEAQALDTHVAVCPACAQELADARRGVAWLGLLKDHTPEPPAALLGNILALTTGTEEPALVPVTAATPIPSGVLIPVQPAVAAQEARGFAGFRIRLSRWLGVNTVYVPALQPRLAMTAAMAFFSVCVTLNLLGVPVQNLHAETLRPAGLQRKVADKGASLLRSFQGIRTVYRVESRVNEWLTASAPQDEAPANSGR